MAVSANDIATILIERIEAAYPGPAYFSADETDDWPAELLSCLLSQRLVAVAERAEAITCMGCEWQCHKHVEIRMADAKVRAFIKCDEAPCHGRVPVDLRQLQRFETGLRMFGDFLGSVLRSDCGRISRGEAAYVLGEVRGRNGLCQVRVAMDDGRLILAVGDAIEPLGRFLVWVSHGLEFNSGHLRRVADRKQQLPETNHRYLADRTTQKMRAANTRKRDLGLFREAKTLHAGGTSWTEAAVELARTELAEGLSSARVRRIIAAERKNSRSKSDNPKRLKSRV